MGPGLSLQVTSHACLVWGGCHIGWAPQDQIIGNRGWVVKEVPPGPDCLSLQVINLPITIGSSWDWRLDCILMLCSHVPGRTIPSQVKPCFLIRTKPSWLTRHYFNMSYSFQYSISAPNIVTPERGQFFLILTQVYIY